MTLYTPKGCKFLSESDDNQIRIGLQGPAFSGKTTAALTFPNPVILTFDRKVSAHLHRKDVPLVPFYDPSFVESIVRKDGQLMQPNRKDSLIRWLSTEGQSLVHEQTLIIDGCSGIEDAYHIWFREHEDEFVTDKGKKDGFAEWKQKGIYFSELWMGFKSLKCDVVFICHETLDRDLKGDLNGKIRPLLTGQVADRMGGNFTDWFAQIVINKPKDDDQVQKVMSWAGVDKATVMGWSSATPPTYRAIHLWQTQGDDLRDCGSSSLSSVPKYILATYDTLLKYRKQFVGTNNPQ
jgi:hypothetical protein